MNFLKNRIIYFYEIVYENIFNWFETPAYIFETTTSSRDFEWFQVDVWASIEICTEKVYLLH